MEETLVAADGSKIFDNEIKEYSRSNDGHGRVEERRVRTYALTQSQKEQEPWDGVQQWCQIKRTRWIRGKKSVEYSYAITSLSPESASPQRILELNRGHWSVESMHWVKDTLLKEDASTIRKGNAPQAIAAIRNMKIALIKSLNLKPKQGHEMLANNLKFITKNTKWIK